ncbi:MAG TPA: wax ester/triacylglycerol synthase family O-acyltransferase [Candidatus Acidoferrum sp.]|nr:wax ester/triacylglycerol synthase family O-acyltransferase [Candidatus Acidoferrum sp.]
MQSEIQRDPRGDRLSWGDTVFLHLEREGMPLNVACVCVFEGEIPLKRCVQFVESKLPLIPRYLKRLVAPPLNIGLPRWEYDATFDIRNHVREVTLKHGSETELKNLAGKILGTVLDRQRPLWDMTFVKGLKGNRGALIIRLHHCLADGIAGVGIMHALMDASSVPPRLPKRKMKLKVPPQPDVLTSIANGCIDSVSDFFQRILAALENVGSMAQRFAANGGILATDEITRMLPEFSAPTERLRFNVLYRGPQIFATAEIPLAEIKEIRKNRATSLNDVILTLVTATVRRYLELHGDDVKGRLFRMMVPVNLRNGETPGEMGNHISLVPVTIPLDIRKPLKLLEAVHQRTDFLKRVNAAELISLTGGLLGMLPTSTQALAGQVLNRLPITPFNMVCTNVPGPQFPLYLLGHKIVHCYPYVPVGGEMTLNCAILTYNGTAYFGFTADVKAAPDLRRVEGLLKLSFAELREAAGVQSAHKKEREKKARKTETRAHAKKKGKVSGSPAVAVAPEEVPAFAPPPPRVPVAKELAPEIPAQEERELAELIA